MNMQPCKFTFDDSPEFEGFDHGSTWNGFDNVAVTAAERAKIAAWMEATTLDPVAGREEAADLMAIEPIKDSNPPLYSLGWGYATLIVRKKPPPVPVPFEVAASVIATRYVTILTAWLTPEEWTEMRARNAADTDSKVCHSHDYCDANMAMCEAFESVTGYTPDGDNMDDATLWNAAWELAMPALGRQA